MNILFANSIEMYGGGEAWMVRTLAALQTRGCNVNILCKHNAEVIPFAVKEGINVLTIDFGGDFNPFSIWKIKKILKENKIHLVLNNMDKELRLTGQAAKLCHSPVVISRHGNDYPIKDKFHYRFTYKNLCDGIIANGNPIKNTLIKNINWLPEDKIKVIHNGISIERFEIPPDKKLKANLEIPEENIIVTFTGRLNIQKGIEYLVEAFVKILEKHKNVTLLIAGEGDKKESIINKINQLKADSNIKLLGFRIDIPQLLSITDIFVLPSLWEGFPSALIEAMAAGCACITTKRSSMPEIIADGINGFLIEAESSGEIEKSLSALIEDESLRKTISTEAKQTVKMNFTLEKMIDNYQNYFSELIKVKAESNRKFREFLNA